MCDLPEVYALDYPTARKEHRCCECRGVIRKGEKYYKHHGIWDHEPAEFKVCAECEELRKRADAEVAHCEDMTAFGQLYETVFESRDLALITAYLANCRARGAKIPEWMVKREAELIAAANAAILTTT
jgi:hypothetical protein